MTKFKFKSPYFPEPVECFMKVGWYSNKRVALQLFDIEDHEPLAKATVNVLNWEPPSDAHILIKDWSENAGVLESLINAKIVKTTGNMIPVGSFGTEATEVIIIHKETLKEVSNGTSG